MLDKSKKYDFDPGGVGINNGNIFGFPYTAEEAEVIIIPVPWDVTTSYQAGTANAPQAILNASTQLDFVDPYVNNAWETKIAMLPIPDDLSLTSEKLRIKSSSYIAHLEEGGKENDNTDFNKILKEINTESRQLNKYVYNICEKYYNKGKIIGILGGDHSCPLGLIQFLASKESFGILQIDAHADLRVSYEDFEFSHASIMHNALKINNVEKLVQVGIRDLSPDEKNRMDEDPKIIAFYDHQLKTSSFHGKTWEMSCNDIVSSLPQNVYISFDIDGLDPKLCPNTGTPVPGGLEFEEASFLIHKVVENGKNIIGFDLCEVNPHPESDWNENVGARILYKLGVLSRLSKKMH